MAGTGRWRETGPAGLSDGEKSPSTVNFLERQNSSIRESRTGLMTNRLVDDKQKVKVKHSGRICKREKPKI